LKTLLTREPSAVIEAADDVRPAAESEGRKAGWTVNAAPAGWLPPLQLGRLWAYRELAVVLALRDLKVRYKQTALGVAWAVIQPLAAAIIFSLVFGRLVNLPSEDVAYPVFVYAGVVLWTYFSNGLDSVSNSLVQNRDLVTKVYFPRLLAPLATALPGLVDFTASLAILVVAMAVYGVVPGVALVFVPLWILGTVVVLLGAGLWLAALNVQYRDVRHTLTFLVQVWLFASPVVYPASLVHGAWRYLYAVNPMSTAINGFRWSLLDARAPGVESFVSLAVALALVAGGLVYFLRADRRFADVI
jgi:lipopolysaccharide transport system permease protein